MSRDVTQSFVGVQSIVVSVSVCPQVCLLNWWRCDMLCTSCVMVILALNWPYRGKSIQLQRVTLLRRRVQVNAPVASYCFRFFPSRRRATRLGESIVEGVPGAEPAVQQLSIDGTYRRTDGRTLDRS